MKIYAIQPDILWERKVENLERFDSILNRISPEPESLVVFPEMFATGFSMNVRVTREAATSLTDQFLRDWARKFRCYIIAGLVRPAAGVFARNEAVLYGPKGSSIGRFAKLHPFPHLQEERYYQPGTQIVIWRIGQWQVAPFICYDLRFPEVFRYALRSGAELFVVLANWPSVRQVHWRILLEARAIENQAYVLGVNRVGQDPNATYSGGSMLVDPYGQIVVELNDKEAVLQAVLDREALNRCRHQFYAWRQIRFLPEVFPQIA